MPFRIVGDLRSKPLLVWTVILSEAKNLKGQP